MGNTTYVLEISPEVFQNVLDGEDDLGEEVQAYLDTLEKVRLYVDPGHGTWEFRLSGSAPLPDDLTGQVKKQLLSRVDGLENVNVLDIEDIRHEDLDKWLEANWEAVQNRVLEVSPILRSAFEYARPRLDGGTLKVELAYQHWVELCRERNLTELVRDWIAERRGESPPVQFETGDFKGEIEEDARKIQVQAKEKIRKQRQRQKVRAEKEQSSVLLGNQINNDPEPIEECVDADNVDSTVTVQGLVVESELVETDEDKKDFLKGIISDRQDSVSFMLFFDDPEQHLTDLEGEWVKIRGRLQRDQYRRRRDEVIFANHVNKIPPLIREDSSPVKRAELHCHTNMSQLDALADVEEIIERAAFWDHPAVAISDHGVVHSFPEAAEAAEEYGVKVIYGLEGYLVDDKRPFVLNDPDEPGMKQSLDDEFVILDCETTGLSPWTSDPFQVAALLVRDGEVVDSYETPVPVNSISENLLDHSRVGKNDLLEAPSRSEIAAELEEFVGNRPSVIYEASFVRNFLEKIGFCVDGPLVHLRRLVEKYWTPGDARLNEVFTNRFKDNIEHDFDALKDAQRTSQIYDELRSKLPEPARPIDIKKEETESDHRAPFNHVLILTRNKTGLKNLYRLVSRSHVEHFFKQPRILRSELEELREGLMIGSACEQGEIFQQVLRGESDEEVKDRMKFYDFIELQPVGNNQFMLEAGDDYDEVNTREDIQNLNRKIFDLALDLGKPVLGTSDAHFLDPEDEKFRRVLQAGQEFSDADNQPPVYFRTTGEMIDEFEYLGEDEAIEVAVENPRLMASRCEDLQPIPDDFYPPEVEGARSEFKQKTRSRARKIYGEQLPPEVSSRLEKEREAILSNHFENLYVVSAMLVEKSRRDGYLVGSRGSVGSSFTAYLMEITEVNPLPPHYRCPDCKFTSFPEDGGDIVGVDLPPETCPECETELVRDGFNIPFEVFCGFEGDKVPDIDLNFSGDYQEEMFHYVEEIFGQENIFRAGTITTVSDRTAAGFVNGYLEDMNLRSRRAEKQRLMKGVKGIKQNTSQHPGGMIIVPEDHSIYEFTPINFPANDEEAEFKTTHFDYHAMEEQLVKLDILGHDNPTQLRHLEDLTGVDPVSVALDDPRTLKLFSDVRALDLTPEELGMEVGVLGVPEFGTSFVRDMVEETRPQTFADLVRISGLSHGENVWLNNARELVQEDEAELTSVITCRDDIMNTLIQSGLPEKIAFQIMEDVRKGRGLDEDQERKMKACGVPEWYIESCQQIQYLFPKAHAAAYVTMAFRIAYYKVHHPAAFYASHLSLKANYLDAGQITSLELVEDRLDELSRIIEQKRADGETTARYQGEHTTMEVLREAYLRGIEVEPPRLFESGARRFTLAEENTLRAPYVSIDGLGGTVADGMKEQEGKKRFTSIEDLSNRTRLNSTVSEKAEEVGFFGELPETENRNLF